MNKHAIYSFIVFSIAACSPLDIKTLDKSTVNVQSKDGLTYVDNQSFSGVLTENSSDGVLISEISYQDGKQEGNAHFWYASGQLKESRCYSNNKKTGEHKGYWPTGVQSFYYHFEEGAYTDTLKEWYPNGQLYKLEYYENGKQVGRQKAWKKEGQLYLNYDIRNGRKYGNAGIKHCKSLWNERTDSL